MQSNRDYVVENLNLKEQIIALKNANQILENLSKNQHTTIENLTNENEILKMNVKDTYDTGQDIICELTQENEKLKNKNLELLIKNNSLNITNILNKENAEKHLKEKLEYMEKCIILQKKVNILTKCIPYYNYKAMHSAGKITDEELEILEKN